MKVQLFLVECSTVVTLRGEPETIKEFENQIVELMLADYNMKSVEHCRNWFVDTIKPLTEWEEM